MPEVRNLPYLLPPDASAARLNEVKLIRNKFERLHVHDMGTSSSTFRG